MDGRMNTNENSERKRGKKTERDNPSTQGKLIRNEIIYEKKTKRKIEKKIQDRRTEGE